MSIARLNQTTLLLAAALLTAPLNPAGLHAQEEATTEELTDIHDPEVERRSFELLPGFEVNLFAAEPMLANPIHMTWDPEGRLWVACSWAYPQLTPGEKPNDKIIVLEDTDGDGRADKTTVFADGLYVPTGLELGDGGVYVANAPDLLFLKDTDGEVHRGRPDAVREPVMMRRRLRFISTARRESGLPVAVRAWKAPFCSPRSRV